MIYFLFSVFYSEVYVNISSFLLPRFDWAESFFKSFFLNFVAVNKRSLFFNVCSRHVERSRSGRRLSHAPASSFLARVLQPGQPNLPSFLSRCVGIRLVWEGWSTRCSSTNCCKGPNTRSNCLRDRTLKYNRRRSPSQRGLSNPLSVILYPLFVAQVAQTEEATTLTPNPI